MGPSIGMNQFMENHTVENWKENMGTLHNEYLHLLKLKDAKLVLPANILPGTTRRSKGDVGTKINSLLNGLYADKFVEDAFFLKIVTIFS